ncbi:MAG: glycoside hydrolase family 10 [Planctomycetota bacterium]
MGHFRFEVPESARGLLDDSLVPDAYLCGIEGVPFQTKVEYDGGAIKLTRNLDSSAKLHLTCRLPKIGLRTLSTCSLHPCERNDSYSLPLELARGSCHMARLQGDVWKQAGLEAGPLYENKLAEGTEHFLKAAATQDAPEVSTAAAIEAISILQSSLDDLGTRYAIQSISNRKNRENQLATLVAASVIPPEPFPNLQAPATTSAWVTYCEAFNTAAVRMSWADIETDSGTLNFEATDRLVDRSVEAGLRIVAGPLIDFRARLLPHWLYLLEDNFDALLASAVSFVEKVVVRYRGRVQVWNAASGLNTPGPIQLDDEQAMRLAVGILQTVRRTDPNTAAILSFDQPCGEYLARHRNGISPMHFADAISRSGLGMAGLGIEFRMGYQSDATPPRSAVDIGTTIDRWATLGMPLLITLAVPGGQGGDHHALAPVPLLDLGEENADAEGWQLKIAGPLLKTMLAKPIVHGIVWEGWHDGRPHVGSHAGLVNAEGHPKPLLEYISRLRQDFLF